MKKILLSLFFTTLSLFSADGQSLSAKCVACHGAGFEKAALGKSAIVYGQSASDIYASLIGYKQGTRNTVGEGALMKGQVASMSNNDLLAVAKYIAYLSEAAPADEEGEPAEEVEAQVDWPFVCEPEQITNFLDKRYLKVSFNDEYPSILADTKTMIFNKKNKIFKTWLISLSSPYGREMKQKDFRLDEYKDYGYNRVYVHINYKAKTMSITEYSDFVCRGSSIANNSFKQTWSLIPPSSVAEALMKSIVEKYNLK